MIYGNEKEVGEGMITAMKKLNLKREDVLVTSKLWCDKHAPVDVRKACEMSIKNLGVDYLDLYLIHFPASFEMKDGVSIATIDPDSVVFEYHKLEDAWGAMEELVHAGLVRSIGVSNFNKRQIERILASCTIPPAVNQVEVNIHLLNTKLIEFCYSKNILVEGYALLGSSGGQVRPVLEEECVVEIAHKHNKTPAQVLLRHGLKRGIVVLVRSVTPERIKSNFDVFDFELTDEETEKLNNIGVNKPSSNTRNIRLTMSANYSSTAHFQAAIRGRINACLPLLSYLHRLTEHLRMLERDLRVISLKPREREMAGRPKDDYFFYMCICLF
ncbi:Aldo-keto reductase family 1 member A1-A [Taenia solium]|eukprot:TsM_000716500 transcript=TsM_000716500 gene=TsM_000716500